MTAWLSKPIAPVIGAALIFLAAAVLSYGTMTTVRGMINDAASAARIERDAHWQAKIAIANEVAANNIIKQMKATAQIESDARATIENLKSELTELEKANAALPDDDACGIDLDRSRLLTDHTGPNRPQ